MRRNGVAIPKYMLKGQVGWRGDLIIIDARDEGVNRVIKMARFSDETYSQKRVETLFDPQLVWMNEERFTLAGFERMLVDGEVVEYAQSWLCRLEQEVPA